MSFENDVGEVRPPPGRHAGLSAPTAAARADEAAEALAGHLRLWPRPRSRLRAMDAPPRRASAARALSGRRAACASTVSATSGCTVTRSRDWISTTTSKVGGALRSRTLFCVRRRRASSSPSVTVWMPPIRSRQRRVEHQVVEVVAVRRADELHAALGDRARRRGLELGADLVDDDDLRACGSRPPRSSPRAAARASRTCMRRARPMPGCGMSPSPAISFEVSTTTTRLSSSSARTRAASRSIVVLPMPGRPMIRTLLPDSTRSLMISIVPNTARPMRAGQADDLAAPVADGARCGAACARCRRGCPRRTSRCGR